MTAIVGILNRHGVAMATDSAVTIRGNYGNKIINNAIKLFSLSKYEPVGVMLYNNSTFYGTPWDVIIKIYRKQLGKKSFPHTFDYVSDFIAFLYSKNFYCEQSKKDELFRESIHGIFGKVESDVINKIGNRIDDKNKDVILQSMKGIFDQEVAQPIKDRCEGLKKFTYEDYIKYSGGFFENFFNDVISKKGGDREFLNSYMRFYYHHLCNKNSFLFPFTGLVFAGYGVEDHYPSIIEMHSSIPFSDNKYRYCFGIRDAISDNNPSGIYPFAQTNVMRNILEGIDPQIRQRIDENFIGFAQGLVKLIQNIANSNNATPLAKALDTLDIQGIYQGFQKKVNEDIMNLHTNPLVRTVDYLEKEDLAEMAESLVSLTYLNKRMMSSEETVGGPVDVAVISKGEGFVWMKRKLYFPAELNPHYIERYYNENV